jgi:tRNA A37 threonylcarbamoyladenosine dehydratase
MSEIFDRINMLLGGEAMERLKSARVAVFGLGGVGGIAAETQCRSGIYDLTLFDGDVVTITNLNRQIVALNSTLNIPKAEAMKNRLLDINPQAKITAHYCFYDKYNADNFDLGGYDYIIDAIDKITCKLLLIERAASAGVPIISSMGAGNRLDGSMFAIGDIKETSGCPLAKVMRRELKKRGIQNLKVVYSKELPVKTHVRTPASAAFVTNAAGLLLAQHVISEIARGRIDS